MHLLQNRVSLGKLIRLNCILAEHTINQQDLSDILHVSEKRIKIKKGVTQSCIEKFLFNPLEMVESEKAVFNAFRREERPKFIGTVYKLHKQTKPMQFLLISERQYFQFCRIMFEKMPKQLLSLDSKTVN